MIAFSLPGFFEFKNLNLFFADLSHKSKEVFNEKVNIDNVYGCPAGIIWTGGRNVVPYKDEIEHIRKNIEDYKKSGVRFRAVLTNMYLEEKHLEDSYANEVLELINEYDGEITLYSPLLKEYVHQKYPNIKFILSTTRCILDIDELNSELDNDYKLIVSDFRKNPDLEFLSKIKDKSRVELLVNEDCRSDCKYRFRHYSDISKDNLVLGALPDTEVYCQGKIESFDELLKQNTTITNDALFNLYSDMGFSNVKLVGRRSNSKNVLESYLYYMIKPEYQKYVREEFEKRYGKN